MILLHWLMAVVGLAGIVWYISDSREIWPILGYFSTLFTAGLVSAAATYFRVRSIFLLAGGLNGVAIGLLVALQVVAFALSPGSGVAAFPFVAVPLAINLISFRWISTEVKGYSARH